MKRAFYIIVERLGLSFYFVESLKGDVFYEGDPIYLYIA